MARAVEAKELQILIAHEPVPTFVGESNLQNPYNTPLDQSQEILRRAEGTVGKVPALIYSELMDGQITDRLLGMAKTRRSDLIIMGAQGWGRLAGALLGINAQRIVGESPCPVLIVK